MSYSIHLEAPPCPACGRGDSVPKCPDPTYNLTPIFDLALTGEDLPNPEIGEGAVVTFGDKTDRARGLRLLDGKRAADSLAMLNAALDRVADERLRDRFLALEPKNRWGDFGGACRVLRILKELAWQHPSHIWSVS